MTYRMQSDGHSFGTVVCLPAPDGELLSNHEETDEPELVCYCCVKNDPQSLRIKTVFIRVKGVKYIVMKGDLNLGGKHTL